MLKETVTYEDFNGETVTEDFYFHYSEAELAELEFSQKGGMIAAMEELVKTNDGKKIIETFKSLVLGAYGVKSDDGRRFIKNDRLREEFSQNPAYSEIFIGLATNAEKAAKFVNGIVPSKIAVPQDHLMKKVQEKQAEILGEAGAHKAEITDEDEKARRRAELEAQMAELDQS